MVVDPDASLLSQLSDLTDISLVSVPSFRQPQSLRRMTSVGQEWENFAYKNCKRK
jgi:hypothetical protein